MATGYQCHLGAASGGQSPLPQTSLHSMLCLNATIGRRIVLVPLLHCRDDQGWDVA